MRSNTLKLAKNNRQDAELHLAFAYFLIFAANTVKFSICRVFTPFLEECEIVYSVGFFLLAGIDVIACCQFGAAMPRKT